MATALNPLIDELPWADSAGDYDDPIVIDYGENADQPRFSIWSWLPGFER